MSGLAVIVVGPELDRARAALRLAAAAAALGRSVAVLFDGPSVTLLPVLADELAAARELGVTVTACATGLADQGVPPPADIETGGIVGFLAAHSSAQLLTV